MEHFGREKVIEKPCNNGRSLLMHVAQCGHSEMIKWLIEKMQVDPMDSFSDIYCKGTSALHLAANCCRHRNCQALLYSGKVDVDVKDHSMCTPLHWACIREFFIGANDESQLALVKMLVEAGADVEAKDIYDMTPLDHSLIKGQPDIIRYLAGDDGFTKVSHERWENPLE